MTKHADEGRPHLGIALDQGTLDKHVQMTG
jgi:hypothetical protein